MTPRFLTLAALAVAAPAWLSGCSSFASLAKELSADGPPNATYSSTKPPREVADCLVSQWNGRRILGAQATTSLVSTDTGLRLTLKRDDTIEQELAIDAEGGGSTTKLWTYGKQYGDKLPHVKQVETCQ